jgi:4-hydroxy-tetrahydrodipicolinate reductase
MSAPIRVIQVSTGNIGTHALRAIIQHPDLELAGLWVHGSEKRGRDAGTLAGLPPTGILATGDMDALLALDAPVVCYCSGADARLGEAVEDFEKILRAGKNIISTSLPFLTHPPQTNPAFRDGLHEAAIAGGATCFVSGIDPGFANDLIPLTLLSVCRHVEQIRIAEILNYSTYNQPHTLFDIMGFGKSLDETPMLLMPGILTFAWGGVIQMMADAAGAKLDDVKEVVERGNSRRAKVRTAGHRQWPPGDHRRTCDAPRGRSGAALEAGPGQWQLPDRNHRRSADGDGLPYNRRGWRP